ncbi:MAG TPA: hypothetical protein VGL94_20535 [Ktedonobacteraceae bacterium]
MRKQQAMTESHKHAELSIWKRLILIVGMLLSGGSLAALVPSQTAYADAGWPQSVFICRAGDGGNGGAANNESNGAAGGTGGDCVNGPKGGTGGAGGDQGSPGGPGGNVA